MVIMVFLEISTLGGLINGLTGRKLYIENSRILQENLKNFLNINEIEKDNSINEHLKITMVVQLNMNFSEYLHSEGNIHLLIFRKVVLKQM